ncbi:MAG: aminotransferase class I/II-fold pyridoxal phosphate-dependent enzyme [Anaerolineales bacterium]|jgi:dTDP-4-amino-4,6-dideoxygalactose transaminase
MVTPPLVSVTLDKDDVTLARKLLKNRKTWEDKSLVSSYEAEFSEWNGSKFVFAFIKGRVALSACIYALGLRPGDEVILPGYTCVVVPNALHFAGLKTVFSDIELDTFGLDASQIENKITSKTRAILIQHLYGLICRDYEALIDIANKYNLKVIEDCAHATGAEFNNQKVGNLGDCAFYSSEKSKIFTTIQGGVAVTNEQEIANKLEEFSNSLDNPDDIFVEKLLNNVIINYYKYKHPQRWWLGMLVSLNKHRKHLISTTVEEQRGIKPLHYGRKMPPPVAMLGSNQLKKIDAYNNSRRETSDRWKKWCLENGYKPPFIKPGSLPVFLRYPLLVEPYKKQNTHWALIDPGVRLGVWFKGNHHPINKPIRNCPKADIAVKQCVNLPGVLE